MTFSYSAGVITQTGTDTSLAGVAGLTGVTTFTNAGGFTIYDLGTNYLVINGTLTIGGSVAPNEMLVVGQDIQDTGNDDIELNGTLNVGHQYTANSETLSQQFQRLIYEPGSGKGFAESNTINGLFLRAKSGCTLNWISGTMDFWGGVRFNSGSTANIGVSGALNKPVWDCTRCRSAGQPTQIWYFLSGSTVDVNGWIVMADVGRSTTTTYGAAVALLSVPTNFVGYEPRHMGVAFTGSSLLPIGTYDIEDYGGGLGCTEDILKKCATGTTTWNYINSKTGTDINVLEDPQGTFNVFIKQELEATTKDTGGANLSDIKLYVEDNEGTSYEKVSSGGTASFTGADIITTGDSLDGTAAVDTFFPTGDVCTLRAIGYLYNLSSYSVVLRGVGGSTVDTVMISDVLITQTTKATVDAYTTIDDAFEWYDRAKSYRYDNYADEISQAEVSRSGSQVDIGATDWVIDSAAAGAYNETTHTIKSSTFTGGVVSSTGKVTIQSATALSGGTFDCDIDYSSTSTTITGATCNGVMDFDTAGTYTLDGCNINEVTNSSGGSVTLRAVNTTITTNTGPSITIEYYSEITHTVKEGATPRSGALVGYWDDTNTNRTYNSSFTNTALTSDGSGNVQGYVRYRLDSTTYTGINLYVGLSGYNRLKIPVTLTGTDVTSDLLITTDVFYTTSPSSNTTINFGTSTITQNGNDTTQGVYDYYIDQWFTTSNIYTDQIVIGSGASFELTNSCILTLNSGVLSGNSITIGTGTSINANGGSLTCGANVVGDLNSANLTVLTGSINMQGGTLDIVDLTSEQIAGDFSSGTIDLDSLSSPTTTDLNLKLVSNLGSGLTVKNDSNEDITVKILPSQTSPTLDVTGPGTGTLTLDNKPNVSNSNTLIDSHVRLYNVTQDTELDIEILTGAGYSFDVPIGTGAGLAQVGDVIRMEVALYRTDGTIMEVLQELALLADAGTSFTGTQTTWTELETIHDKGTGFEGPNVTGFTLDVPNIEVDISVTEISGWKLATWLYYQISTTTDGMRNYFAAFTDLDSRNFSVDASVVSLKVDNTGLPATWVDASWVRDDGESIVSASSEVIQFQNGLINVVHLADTAIIDNIKADTSAILVDTADMQPKLGTPAGADMSADIAAVKTETASIQVDTNSIETKVDTVDTVVDAVKVKTDQLTFTKSNELDSNIQSVNDITVDGTGVEGSDPWGPA